MPEQFLRKQTVPANLSDPVTVEDLILQISILEGMVERSNINLDAIRHAMDQPTQTNPAK